jgi:SAM-dependent methyltransferase
MALDIHVLNLMRYALKHGGSFKRTATIGRQWLFYWEQWPDAWRFRGPENRFCENVIKRDFGAEIVDSFDNSDYEQCTHVVDMGAPLPTTFVPYDTVIDGGCLEHIFNAPQALKNVTALTKPGGQILHILPTDNNCGHGFWQFSPELFFSLYSEKNGYRDTKVFIADFMFENIDSWFEAARPRDGHRVEWSARRTSNPVYALVRTVRGETVSQDHVYQSDYVRQWGGGGVAADPRAPEPDFTERQIKDLLA